MNYLEKYYEMIENAVAENSDIYLPLTDKYLNLKLISSTKMLVTDLFWIDEKRNIYCPVLEVLSGKSGLPALKVSISTTLDGFSSNDLSMFKKENRYTTII